MTKVLLVSIVLASIFCQGLTLEVKIDGKRVHNPWTLVTLETMRSFYRQQGSDLDYIEGSRTYDTVRYNGGKPFWLSFRDRYNHRWEIGVNEGDALTVLIPCGTQMIWYGGTPARLEQGLMLKPFHYERGGWLSKPGVRITFVAYKDRRAGEWQGDSERWKKVLDYAEQGTKISQSIMNQIEQGVALYRGGKKG